MSHISLLLALALAFGPVSRPVFTAPPVKDPVSGSDVDGSGGPDTQAEDPDQTDLSEEDLPQTDPAVSDPEPAKDAAVDPVDDSSNPDPSMSDDPSLDPADDPSKDFPDPSTRDPASEDPVLEGADDAVSIDPIPIPAGDADYDSVISAAYSLFHSMDLSDYQIAGILGNWQVESGLDPACIEGIYSEPFIMGKRKKAALADLDAHTRSLLDHYAQRGVAINRPAYLANGSYWCGMGLGQLTGPAAMDLVLTAARAGANPLDTEWQLAYLVSGRYRGYFFSQWQDVKDETEAADQFLARWEGCPGHSSLETRQRYARGFYQRIKDLDPDMDQAKRILSMATEISGIVYELPQAKDEKKEEPKTEAKKKETPKGILASDARKRYEDLLAQAKRAG